MSGISIAKRKTGKSKAISDAFFCDYEGCMKPSKHDMTFLDHYWEKMHLCDKHVKEMKEILSRFYD